MALYRLEHSPMAYFGDFAFYAAAIIAMVLWMVLKTPATQGLLALAVVIAALTSWTLVEYLMHRFLLHGLQPFKGWHAEHHRRPTALLGTPTLLSAGAIGAFVTLPGFLLGGAWLACALTLGVVTGYLSYGLTHHATHHWRPQGVWLHRRKRAHARHHACKAEATCFGVTSNLWDCVCGTAARRVTLPPGALSPRGAKELKGLGEFSEVADAGGSGGRGRWTRSRGSGGKPH